MDAKINTWEQLSPDTIKTYVIINGESMYLRKFKTTAEAKQFAENYLDNSNEIIIREIISLDINDKQHLQTINNVPL